MTPIAFTEMNIKRAPPTGGIYALYRDGEVIYYGHALGAQKTIQSRLKDHIAGRDSPCTRGAMTFSWEACPDPAARETALVTAFEQLHNGPPRCNAPR
jgi:hypothetical protein